MNGEDAYLAHCVTTYTLDKRHFFNISEANVSTILNTINFIEGFDKTNTIIPNGTEFYMNDALYSIKYRRKLFSFKDIHRNGYLIEIMNESNIKYFYINFIISSKKLIVEKLSSFSLRLYYITIKVY